MVEFFGCYVETMHSPRQLFDRIMGILRIGMKRKSVFQPIDLRLTDLWPLAENRWYFQAFLQFLRFGVQEGFIREGHRSLLVEGNQPETLLDALEKYQPVSINKWTGEETNSF